MRELGALGRIGVGKKFRLVIAGENDDIATGAVAGSAGYNTNWGATAGVGLEYGFAPNWSAAVEYDHIFQSTGTFRFVTPAGASIGNPLRDGGDTDLVTVRLNYRWGGPLIARY